MIRSYKILPPKITLPVALLVSATLAMGGAGAAEDTPFTPTDAHQYADCLALAGNAPELAMDVGFKWVTDGGGAPAKHCLAIAQVRLGLYEDAATMLEQVAGEIRMGRGLPMAGERQKEGPELYAELFGQAGNVWLLAGDPNKAYSALSQGLIAAVDYPRVELELLIDRARASGEAGDFKAAVSDLDRAQLMDSGRPEIYLYRASAHRQLDQLPAAEADLENALRLQPFDAVTLLERGNLRALQGDLAGARADWLSIKTGHPDTEAAAAARNNLERLDLGTFDADADEPGPVIP